MFLNYRIDRILRKTPGNLVSSELEKFLAKQKYEDLVKLLNYGNVLSNREHTVNIVRVHAIKALGNSGDKRAVEVLSRILNYYITNCDGNTWPSGEAASESLIKLVQTFGNNRDKEAVDLLIGILKNVNGVDPSVVAEALGKIGDRKAVDRLLDYIWSNSVETRLAVAEALGELRDPKAMKKLLWTLGDSDQNVRRKIKEALEKLEVSKEELFQGYVRALGSGGEVNNGQWQGARAEAADALGDMGDKIAIEPLRKLLDDKYESVRSSAARAIAKLDPAKTF